MKKVLFATTALVAFAGAAAAEVTISGSAEMGVVGGGVNAINGSQGETQYWNDVDIRFTLTGESDAGISFGAVVDLDEAGNLGRDYDNQGTSVFISGAFGTLTMGDTDGALDWALTDAGNIGNPGSIDDSETTHLGYMGNFGDGFSIGNLFSASDNQILRYDHTVGPVSFAVSYEQGADPATGLVFPGSPSDGAWSVGVKYALDLGGTTVNLGAGYHSADFVTDNQEVWGLGAAADLAGGFSAGFTYSDWSNLIGVTGSDATHVGIGLGYATGPISAHVNWGQYDFDGAGTSSSWGLAAAYDLGGGLSAHLGYSDSDDFTPDSDQWSLGMSMSF